MRHDPAAGAIVIMLRSLKMHGLAQAVTDLIEQGAPAFEVAIPILSQLLKAELAEREVRSIAYHMKAARFPAYTVKRHLPLRAKATPSLTRCRATAAAPGRALTVKSQSARPGAAGRGLWASVG